MFGGKGGGEMNKLFFLVCLLAVFVTSGGGEAWASEITLQCGVVLEDCRTSPNSGVFCADNKPLTLMVRFSGNALVPMDDYSFLDFSSCTVDDKSVNCTRVMPEVKVVSINRYSGQLDYSEIITSLKTYRIDYKLHGTCKVIEAKKVF